jgi:cytochrome c oxidase subunit 2
VARRVARGHLLRLTTAAAVPLCGLITTLALACGGGDSDGELPPAAEEGRAVAEANGCTACHTDDGTEATGPTWDGLFGSTVRLSDGRTVEVDRDYVTRSIRDPGADVVDGFSPVMPTIDLTDEEIDAVIAYLEFLAGD